MVCFRSNQSFLANVLICALILFERNDAFNLHSRNRNRLSSTSISRGDTKPSQASVSLSAKERVCSKHYAVPNENINADIQRKRNPLSFVEDISRKAKVISRNTAITAALLASVLFAPIGIDIDVQKDSDTNHQKQLNLQIHPTKMQALAVTENQQFVSDVWWAVTTQFFDPTFNGLTEEGWRKEKMQAMQKVSDTGPDDEAEVAGAIQSMLSALGDPYTRFLPREKYETLAIYAKGGSAGIGVQLLMDLRSNEVQVANVVENGPAAKMGLRQGDVILEIDGESMEGATAEIVAAKCRGDAGGKVDVLVRHEDGGIKGAIGTKDVERLSIERENLKVNPVRASTFFSSSSSTGDGDQRKIGLLTIPAFSQETPGQVIDAVRSVKDDGAQAIVIDLRGNVGGYMPAGIDTAKVFLAGRRAIVAEVNRAGQATAYYADGIGSETSMPLYILVDGKTASAAEIFSAALQDNRRAVLVGSKTFGKGRIQNVQSVGNGSGVAVTRARYITPNGRDVHGVGITPNKESSCSSEDSAAVCLANIV